MKEKWLNDLQARIQKEYHVSAPEGLLDNIKSEMLRRGITPKHSRQQKSRIVPLWLYSSISIAAMVIIGLYLFNASTNSSLLSDQAVTMLDHKASTTPNLTIKKTHSQDYTLSNTLKHSGASAMVISILEHPAFYSVSVQDNGTGCSDTEPCVKGIGLTVLSEIAARHNGTIHFYSQDGFKVHITFPKK